VAVTKSASVLIDHGGAIVRIDDAAREAFKAVPGPHSVHRAGAVVVLVHDDDAGSSKPAEQIAIVGDIKTMSLLGLANLLGQNRETGRLVVRKGETERVVLLKNGDIASVGSNLPRDRLGAFLIRLGRVNEEQMEQAQALSKTQGVRIGQVLVQQKLIAPHELWSCIQEQITELFADIVQWTEGSFVLYRVPDDHPFPTTPALTMQGLLMESVRRADEMSVFRGRIPGITARLRRTKKDAPAELPDEERSALKALGAEASVADVARGAKVNEFEATRLCYQLLKAGLIEIPKAPTGAAIKAFQISDEDKQRLYLYNLAFREIRDEIGRHGRWPQFLESVRSYLADKNGAYHALFRGVPIDDNGALHESTLTLNLSALGGLGQDVSAMLVEALNELTFFMLFQSSELLDQKSDENLGRRVRLIHASLPQAAR
jgi:Domain of unknown function (DUF4388)